MSDLVICIPGGSFGRGRREHGASKGLVSKVLPRQKVLRKAKLGIPQPTMGPCSPVPLCSAFLLRLQEWRGAFLLLIQAFASVWMVSFLWGCCQRGSSKKLLRGRPAWWWTPQTGGPRRLGLSLIPGPHSVPRALPNCHVWMKVSWVMGTASILRSQGMSQSQWLWATLLLRGSDLITGPLGDNAYWTLYCAEGLMHRVILTSPFKMQLTLRGASQLFGSQGMLTPWRRLRNCFLHPGVRGKQHASGGEWPSQAG